jgi:hypothetical protein
MTTLNAPLSEEEVRQFVNTWFAKLDVHAPVDELLPMLADTDLEMHFPEVTCHNYVEFQRWYESATHRFFDEVHTMKELTIRPEGDQASVQLIVNWQTRIWEPPAPKSQWLSFDAVQRWVVKQSPQTKQLVIVTYSVYTLTPMPGSANL